MREWMKLFEGQSLINVDVDKGSAEGYVTDDPNTITNWFMYRHDVYDASIIEMILSEYEIVAFLNNINVGEESRGAGLGNRLLSQFEDKAMDLGAQAIILFADINEDQVAGFDIEKWYKSKGYEEIHPSEGLLYCPLMIKDCR